jgi:hypothetical protein
MVAQGDMELLLAGKVIPPKLDKKSLFLRAVFILLKIKVKQRPFGFMAIIKT